MDKTYNGNRRARECTIIVVEWNVARKDETNRKTIWKKLPSVHGNSYIERGQDNRCYGTMVVKR